MNICAMAATIHFSRHIQYCIIQCAILLFFTWRKLTNKQSDFPPIRILLLSQNALRAGHLCHRKMTLVFPWQKIFALDPTAFFPFCSPQIYLGPRHTERAPSERVATKKRTAGKKSIKRAYRIKVLDNNGTDTNRRIKKRRTRKKLFGFEKKSHQNVKKNSRRSGQSHIV